MLTHLKKKKLNKTKQAKTRKHCIAFTGTHILTEGITLAYSAGERMRGEEKAEQQV